MTAIKYIIFAIISTAFNLLFQYLSFEVYDQYLNLSISSEIYDQYLSTYIRPKLYHQDLRLYFGMFCGTIAGLLSKYILDKKYIFYHKPKSKKDDAKKFILYSMMGVFTTFIFWSTEIAFDHYSDHPYAKYVGAVVGLSIGYVVKFFLDKKFVFKVKK